MAAGDRFRRILDRGRSIASRYGLRPTTVTVRVKTWSGTRVGEGVETIVNTPLLIRGTNPKVVEVSTEDVVASGGRYESGALRIGPLTPSFPGGGIAYSTVDPSTNSSPTEVFFVLQGPADAVPMLYRRADGDTDSALHHFVVVNAVGQVA